MDFPVFEILLTTLVYGGEAMGRLPDGKAVFVPFGIPGEKVRVRLVEEKRGFARGELLEILEPSPLRIKPRCVHFSVCGGCQYQHLPYPAQLEVKQAILRDQLERIGKIDQPPVGLIVPSPSPWFYRNNVQFHLSSEGILGYQRADSNQVIPIVECFLPVEPINDTWPLLDIEPFPGLYRVDLRSGSEGDLLLVMETEGEEAPELRVEDIPISVVQVDPIDSMILAGSGGIEFDILGRHFWVSASSFFQVNTPVAEKMILHLLEILPLKSQPTLLEVYCGVGLFSAFLAPKVKHLVGIESSQAACGDFELNLDEFDHVELYEAEAELVLPVINFSPDILLVDPPRAGLGRHVIGEILRLEPETLAYISCDPSTLARDLRMLLEGGYILETITPFDLFPQTAHIESISLLRSSEK